MVCMGTYRFVEKPGTADVGVGCIMMTYTLIHNTMNKQWIILNVDWKYHPRRWSRMNRAQSKFESAVVIRSRWRFQATSKSRGVDMRRINIRVLIGQFKLRFLYLSAWGIRLTWLLVCQLPSNRGNIVVYGRQHGLYRRYREDVWKKCSDIRKETRRKQTSCSPARKSPLFRSLLVDRKRLQVQHCKSWHNPPERALTVWRKVTLWR